MSRQGKLWLAVLAAAILVRVATLAAYPLHDTTEARYAEVARLMVESGDWITPHIQQDVPFWGKPPLSFWLTSASFAAFGLSEFSARLPSLLLTLATLMLVFKLGRSVISRDAGVGATAIMLTCAIGFIGAGAVMTDASLTLATTLAFVAFWFAMNRDSTAWGYLFFAAIGLGLLAKGPIALVLVAVPLAVWLLVNRAVALTWRRLPCIGGPLLTLTIAVPWYLLAELKTPGFLEYFLIGEHWLRFVDGGWQGDLYGSAHEETRGTIWLFGLAAALPWSLVALPAVVPMLRDRSLFRTLSPFQHYLILWMLTPLVFFSFAGNILPAYVLPGVPAFALLLSAWVNRQAPHFSHCGWFVSLLMLSAGLVSSFDLFSNRSQKDLVNYYDSLSTTGLLFYYPSKPHSANFYSRGEAQEIASTDALLRFFDEPGANFIAVRRKHLDKLPRGIASCFRVEKAFPTHLLLSKSACESMTSKSSALPRPETEGR